jgi:hypothetical protein
VNISKGHRVKIARDIKRGGFGSFRADGVWHETPGPQLYAKAGDEGEVVETFRSQAQDGPGVGGTWAAKVKMDADGKIKTFRLTSLTRTK